MRKRRSHSLVIIRNISRQSTKPDIRTIRQDPFSVETFLPGVGVLCLDLKVDSLLVFDVVEAGFRRVVFAAEEVLQCERVYSINRNSNKSKTFKVTAWKGNGSRCMYMKSTTHRTPRELVRFIIIIVVILCSAVAQHGCYPRPLIVVPCVGVPHR